MTKSHNRFLIAMLVATCAASNFWGTALAASDSPAQIAESIRASLMQAQLSLSDDQNASALLVKDAETAYQTGLSGLISVSNPDAHLRVLSAFEILADSAARGDVASFAAARAQVWTGILAGSYTIVEDAIQTGDGLTAQTWLPVREFRIATRFSRPNVGATLAVEGFIAGTVSAEDALQSVHADVLDTYQARMTESLRDLTTADANGFSTRRAELASLAEGYFFILSPAYLAQRGTATLANTQAAFADLRVTAGENPQLLNEKLAAVEDSLNNFRAAPLSPDEQSRRAGQLLRFLSLVPVEYERGVVDGRVTRDLEIQEAITFHEAAQAAFDDLRDLLSAQNSQNTIQAAELIETLGEQLADTSTNAEVAAPEEVGQTAMQLITLLETTMPEEWKKGSTAGDFDVIDSMLDQMETAVRNGEYDLAESARLEAYAVLESGPEVRLSVLAPQSKIIIEDLFWNGQGENKGLAFLIGQKAPLSEIKTSRTSLDAELKVVEEILSVQSAPLAIVGNAGIIVFREGLEAVIILASLMGSMKTAESRKYRPSMWWGTGLALLATVVTWILAHGILVSLARYGEKLEAVVSLIAIVVLLLITNWFFHKTYWTGWIASFQSKKKRLLTGEAGLILGLVSLGFTSVYREGFETVLFLQALVLDSGTGLVLAGVTVGFAATVLVGVVTFKLQARLPYMNMLIITGILIGGVLLVMVGKTVHILQVVGWMPTAPILGMTIPYWIGTWFGTYSTWQGIILQLAAAGFVIGSYYLAEGLRKRKIKEKAKISTQKVEAISQ